MQIVNCLQGSEQWENARRGRPTASRFKDILTPAKLDLSKTAQAYAIELALELKGVHDESKFAGNYATDRGTENEPLAVEAYEQKTGRKCQEVGFVYPNHSRDYGCSPDRFVLDSWGDPVGLIEVKTRYPRRLMEAVLDPEKALGEYMLQVQAQLWITGLPWCDLVLFAPELHNLVIVRVEPDQRYLEAFEKEIPQFVKLVHAVALYVEPNPDYVPKRIDDDEFVEWDALS